MGWMFGWHTRKALAEHLLTGNGPKTLKHCWKGNNLWAVQEWQKKDGTPVRFVALYLCKGRDGDPHGWGYKDLDESAHPFHYNCPISYIELVEAFEKGQGSEPVGHAAEWRAEVRKRDALAKRKLAVGQHIKIYDNEYTVSGLLGRRGYLLDNGVASYRIARSQIQYVEVQS